MIPIDNDFNIRDINVTNESSKTYLVNKKRIDGLCDNKDALKQSIQLILNTQRYKYPIYSWNYGVELDDLIGQPITYVIPILESRLKEALMQDDRILDVVDFTYDVDKKILHSKFTVNSIYGYIDVKKDVKI